jgi:uncharacterized glyoxalase superfamily protein PhnB
MSTTRFAGLNLVSSNMENTIAFYRLLGVDIPADILWESDSGIHHVELPIEGGEAGIDLDSQQLAASYNAGWHKSQNPCVIGFSVETRDAVDEHHDKLSAAGYTSLQPPYDAFWGARYAIIEDPDGNPVGIMSPRDPAHQNPPPSL